MNLPAGQLGPPRIVDSSDPTDPLQVSGANRKRLATWAAAVVGTTALTLAAWLRLPGLTRDTLWAEDGGVFLRQALGSNFLSGVMDPYDGYLHLLPRMLAHLSLRTGPLDGYAERISWLSCACVGLVGIAVFFLSRPHVSSTGSRVLLAAIPALLPVGPLEVLGNTANLHWYMLWLMPWILIHPTRRRWSNTMLAALAFAAATTEIQTVLFIPLVWVAVRTGSQWGGSVGVLAGLAMQFITFVSFPRSVSTEAVPWDLGSVIIGWLLQGSFSSVESSASSVGVAWTYFGGALLLVPVALLVVPVVAATLKGRSAMFSVVAFLGISAALWFAAQVFNNRAFMNYSSFTNEDWLKFDFLRYAAAPAMFTLGAMTLAAGGFQWRRDDRVGSGNPRRFTWETICAAVVATILVLGFFPPTSSRADGPSWRAQVLAGRVACEAEPLLAEVPVLVAPRGWEFERVAISCNRLRINNNESR